MGAPKPQSVHARKPPVVLVGCLLLLAVIVACACSSVWRDIFAESVSYTWVIGGWSVLFISPIIVSIVEHRKDGKPWAKLWRAFWEHIHSTQFCILAICVLLVFFTTVAYVIPAKLKAHEEIAKKEQQLGSKMAQEIERLRAGGTPYPTLAKTVEKEKSERLRVEVERDQYKYRYLENLSNQPTNILSMLTAIDLGVEFLNRERSKIPTTNVALLLRNQRERQKLELDKLILARSVTVTPFNKLAHYAVNRFQPMINDLAGKCGSTANTVNVPTVEWMATYDSTTNKQVVAGTNCNWKLWCNWRGASMQISIAGPTQDGNRGHGDMRLNGEDFQITYSMVANGKRTELLSENCKITETTNCIAHIDNFVDMLTASIPQVFE